jgi:hypothetical protein
MFPHDFHLSNIVTERLAVEGSQVFDLGVQPLSVVYLALKPLNDTGTLANYCNAYRIAQAVNRATISYRGSAIHSMRGEDLIAFNWLRWGMTPAVVNGDNVDNERRALMLPIVMGRYPFMKESCFPGVGKGELTIELDLDIADTGYDGLRVAVHTLELPGAKPKEFEKRVQQGQTWAATGQNDIDLPVGNIIRGLFLWGTTGFDGATPAPSWQDVTVLLDNMESGFRGVPWELVKALPTLWGRAGSLPTPEDDHFHIVTTDGNAQTALETLGGSGHNRATTYNNAAFLDFDPTGDDRFALSTVGKSRLQIRTTAGTADAVRCVPVEKMTPSDIGL